MPAEQPLTENIANLWTVVAAILFPTTDSYACNVEIADVRADREPAVVWTQTRTVTQRKGIADPMVLEFSEMYFLVNTDHSGWRIAGTAPNRPVDEIPVSCVSAERSD